MEREEFRQLCLMLHPELWDVDIPHCTTMHECINQTSEEVLANLSQDIQVSLDYYYFADKLTFYLENQYWKGLFYHRFVV